MIVALIKLGYKPRKRVWQSFANHVAVRLDLGEFMGFDWNRKVFRNERALAFAVDFGRIIVNLRRFAVNP